MSATNLEQILLVDDSDADVALIMRGLKKYGNIQNEIIPFYSAESFLEYLELVLAGEKPFPAIVLLDINLPAMSGHAALKNLRAHPEFRRIPAVAMVSHSKAQEDIDSAIENGANGYFIKPALAHEWTAFSRYVEDMLSLARELATLPPDQENEYQNEFFIFEGNNRSY